jgi:uncharacterized DUF497 family protein
VRFDWDPRKNTANRNKHSLSFEEASHLFAPGVEYLEIFDVAHSDSEDRFICIGPIRRGIVVVVMTEIEDDVLRLISARFATPREARAYQSKIERDGS